MKGNLHTGFSDEQIITVLKEHEAGAELDDLARCLGVSEGTILRWKSSHGNNQVPEKDRLRQLEGENAMLKRLLAEAELDKAALKELIRGNW
jgi:putative transposase